MKIVTDCAAEFSADELHSLGIIQAPLYINFPEKSISSADIGVDEFYSRLEAMFPTIPSTAQPSSSTFAEIYRQLSVVDRDVLSVHISSGLSGTINSARMGAEQVKGQANVSVFDTMTLSGGQRFMVYAAAKAAQLGWPLQKIIDRLVEIRANTEAVYTLETLDYLARGGRIGRISALAGSLLKIKPVIHVDHKDGKYSTVGKTRSIPQAMDVIVDYLSKVYGPAPLCVNLMHGRFFEMADTLAKMLKQKLNIASLEILRVSPVLGVHTGPQIVGAAVVPMEFMKDLI